MSGGAVVKAAKPVMRGLLHKQIRFNVITALSVAVAAGIAQKFLVGEKRKAVYAEFYKTYDIEKEFDTMRKKGLFTSCPE